ncbi:MAG: hypothetical protein FRX49_11315 [Trebouxia sp. A1-2]|nr:MAG: hypothetical protein FRX49_11315 [Trebouxia sp. A1-2]
MNMIAMIGTSHNSLLSEMMQGRTAQQESKVVHSQDNKESKVLHSQNIRVRYRVPSGLLS